MKKTSLTTEKYLNKNEKCALFLSAKDRQPKEIEEKILDEMLVFVFLRDIVETKDKDLVVIPSIDEWRESIRIYKAILRGVTIAKGINDEYLIDFVKDFANEPCEYGDNCPTFAGTRHGQCHNCRAREALENSHNK
jgi:hypothetical protein